MANSFDFKTFNPQVFAQYVETIPRLRLNELVRSGALTPNAQISAMFGGEQVGSFFGVVPFFGRIGGDAQKYIWKCEECGFKNSISRDNIYESHEDFFNP
jgi:hypothetical protein